MTTDWTPPTDPESNPARSAASNPPPRDPSLLPSTTAPYVNKPVSPLLVPGLVTIIGLIIFVMAGVTFVNDYTRLGAQILTYLGLVTFGVGLNSVLRGPRR